MAKRKTSTVATPVESVSRARLFTQGETVYEIWGSEKSTGVAEILSSAKTAPAALATLELAQSMGAKTHSDFYVQKVSRMTVANGQLIDE